MRTRRHHNHLSTLHRMTSLFRLSPASLLGWTAAYSIWEPISYFLIRAASDQRTVGEYYDPKRTPVPIVFFGDFIYSTFILLVVQALSTSWGITGIVANLALFVSFQWVSDLLWYVLVTALPKKTSRYVDFFQRYGGEVGFRAVVGDSLYGLVWIALSQGMMSSVPVWMQLVAIVLFLFGTLVVSY